MPAGANGKDGTTAAWDDFLESSPLGQFQQTSGWAQVKALEGWSAVREPVSLHGPSLGGFQLLWRRTKLASVGYMSKGPVLAEESEPAVSVVIEKVVDVARRLGLAAVVVQPPDDSAISSDALVRYGFFPEPLESVIRTTAIISLEGGGDGAMSRMSRKVRYQWRSARRQGLALTWGTRSDLPLFFRLMCESARRQHSIPNPGRVDVFEALWDSLQDRIRLAFVEHQGRTLAGQLLIAQRDRIVFWKKGWNGADRELFANQFLATECLRWASAAGFASADLMGISPDIATRILANEPLTDDQYRGRDAFSLSLGARPKLLPPAHLLVVRPGIRRLAYAGLRWQLVESTLERRIG